MKKLFTAFLLLVLSSTAMAEGEFTQTYYRDYKLTFEKADNLIDKIESGALKDGEYYFMVKSKDNRTFSVGYYDNKGNIHSYLLDRFYNLKFHYITYDYKSDVVISKKFKDTTDFTLGRIDYEYNEQKKVSRTVIWVYSLPRREMVKMEETIYGYKDKGEKYDIVERYNTRNQTYEKLYYRGTDTVQEYERYDIDGKTLQYKIKLSYENEKIKKEYFSKADVLLKTVYEKNEKSQKTN